MLSTQRGSQNGINIELFKSGKEYNVMDGLAEIFLKQMKCAVTVTAVKPEPEPVKQAEVKSKITKAFVKPTKNKKG